MWYSENTVKERSMGDISVKKTLLAVICMCAMSTAFPVLAKAELTRREQMCRAIRQLINEDTVGSPIIDVFLLSLLKALEPTPFKFRTYKK